MVDPVLIRMVIGILGLGFLLSLGGGFWLTMAGKEVPQYIVAACAGAASAVGAILAKTSSTPDSVTIDNSETDPVQTEEVTKKKGK